VRVPPQVSTESVAAPNDPRFDGIVQALKSLGSILGQQAQDRAIDVDVVSTATSAVIVVVATLVEAQSRVVIEDQATISKSKFSLSINGNQLGERLMSEERCPISPNRKSRIGKSKLNSIDVCRVCKKRHGFVLCCKRERTCYKGRQYSHLIKDCPYRQMES